MQRKVPLDSVLNDVGMQQAFRGWIYRTDVPSQEEMEKVRFYFMSLCREYKVEVSKRKLIGRYIVYKDTRTMEGLLPITHEELFILMLHMCAIIFNQPTIDHATQFLTKLAPYYAIDTHMWNNLVEKFNRELSESNVVPSLY